MKEDLKNKICGLVKRFPAVTYGIIGIMVLMANALCAKCVEAFGFILAPFVPVMLIYAGFVNLFSNKISFITEWAIGIFFLFVILIILDSISFLLRKFFVKCFGDNKFAKISPIIITIFLWLCVFVSLIEVLPIDV